MNRTDRLYAIVEELRAVTPRPRSASWLAARFEVSTRTIERDIDSLQQSGTPVWAEPGRTGGYCIDAALTLPPVNLTADEAVALSVGLRLLDDSPFRHAAHSAQRKLLAAMQTDDAAAARRLAGRVHLLRDGEPIPAIAPSLASALSTGRVLRIEYADREGTTTRRDIEPLGYIGSDGRWYLEAWCRLRSGIRAFRIDRIVSVVVTAETPEPRALALDELGIQYGVLTPLDLD